MTTSYDTDYVLIERTLLSWVETYTGIGAGNGRWLNQVMGRPAKPYATLQIIADPIMGGIDAEYQKYNNTTEHIDKVTFGDRRMSLQVTTYTDPPTAAGQLHARHILNAALASLRSQVVQDLFSSAGLSFWQQLSGVQEIDEQLGQRWEHRAQVDLEFGYVSIFTDKPEAGGDGTWIESLKVDISEDNGTLIIQS